MSDIDIDGTREQRQQAHQQLRLRAHLLNLLTSGPLDSSLVKITPYELVEGGEPHEPEAA